MLKYKESPEDFKVTEVIDLSESLDPKGDYVYFWLTKKGYNTVQLVKKLGDFCLVKGGRIGFAGAKDKVAVTKQAISFRDPEKRLHKDVFSHFNSERIQLEFIGRGKKPISLGDNKGNLFDIIVESDTSPKRLDYIINYFDDQRFSINNHIVGKSIIRKDWKKACADIIEDSVKEHLKSLPSDYIGALKKIPFKTLLVYVHAYQSYIWNLSVSHLIDNHYKDKSSVSYTLGSLPLASLDAEHRSLSVPIVGFGSELDFEPVASIIHEILVEEGFSLRDFIIPSFPELSADGGLRSLAVNVDGLEIEDLGSGRYNLQFFLPKGAYATMLIKQMFC